jgi:hypothetical protein
MHSLRSVAQAFVYAGLLIVCIWPAMYNNQPFLHREIFALAGDAAFTIATTKMFGEPPIRPPFLAARVVADAPGASYLKARCSEAGFTLCRFVNWLPVVSTDTFLWSPDPTNGGVFAPSDPATQRGLSDEQCRFVLAVFMADPVGQTTAMVKDTNCKSGKCRCSTTITTNK